MEKENNQRDLRWKAILQIILVISLSISFPYLMNEGFGVEKINYDLRKIIPKIGEILFNELNIVNALEVSDLDNGAWTCLESKTGVICQEFIASECNDKCKTACIPSPMKDVAQCSLGACYNNITGICSLNAPKERCEYSGLKWFNDPNGNVNECRAGCCIIGGSASLKTEQQCNRESDLIGTENIFRPDIVNELRCINAANSQEEGACTYGGDGTINQCKFTTRQDCEGTIRGEFYSGFLCSNPELNTSCQAQARTSCISGKDQVYWLDSCGNKENVYSLPKAQSWNNGRVMQPNEICNVQAGNNNLANSKTCGNCNYLKSSVCRKAGIGEVSAGDYVCKSISCIDENGKERQNGESWCSYQGKVGVDGGKSTDTPGSRHFRNTCARGEVTQEPCQDYRNGICTESRTNVNGKEFSTATCRINSWQQCINYNTKRDIDGCGKNPDCFVKSVAVSKDFKFDVCAPKYPEGFLLDEGGRGEGAEGICGIATQKCTYVKVKGVFSDKKINEECLTANFAQQMNDLCMSLGDCGASANYLGDVSESYRVSNSPRLSASYLANLKRYADESLFKGQYAKAVDIKEYYGEIGFPGFIDASIPDNGVDEFLSSASLPAGAVGVAVPLLLGHTTLGVGLATFYPWINAFGGALAGAAVGFALTSLLLQITGVGKGLSSAEAYSLLALGTAGGALLGFAVMKVGFSAAFSAAGSAAGIGGGAAAGAGAAGAGAGAGGASAGGASGGASAGVGGVAAAGIIIIVVVIIIIILLMVFGIGKEKRIDVQFTCKPWQAPLGGINCGKCGSDGFPCSRYSCSSLGQTCQLINENTESVECVNINPNDVIPPRINPLIGLISIPHSFSNITENGFRIKKDDVGASGCLEPYSQLIFGMQLDEPGQCRVTGVGGKTFDEMEQDFGLSSLFRRNHTIVLPVPDLRALGYNGYIPANASTEFNFYVKCQDKNGNKNPVDYSIGFCIQKGIDLSPPVITNKVPTLEYVAWNETSKNVTLWTNEPSECRWSFGDKVYDSMENNMSCKMDFEDQELYGWECENNYPIQANNNSYFVRCKDQPWVNTTVVVFNVDGTTVKYYSDNINYTHLNELDRRSGFKGITNITLPETIITDLVENGMNKTQSRNTNQQSYVFSLRKSINQLGVRINKPINGTIVSGVEPTSVDIEIETYGGVDGRAECKYKFGEVSSRFFETYGKVHKQTFQTLFGGQLEVPVECEDIAGNKADNKVKIDIKIDRTAPKVVRAYATFDLLTVVTDENARCVYSTESCAFSFNNATSMGGSDKSHSTTFNKKDTYYIKCKDIFDRGPGSACNVIIKGQKV
ncbi:MAG: hypothetical protein AABW80_03360 [Nanoarchaeota archaeon]